MRTTPILLAGIALTTLAMVEPLQSNSLDDVIKGYRKWAKATKTPQDMSPALALSCIGPMKWDRADNPHVPKVFEVYVNAVGAKAMRREGSTVFPDGTIIIKEKYNRSELASSPKGKPMSYDRKLKPTARPVLLTLMLKLNGEWSYYTCTGEGYVLKANCAPCISCHEFNKVNDYVFRPYVKGAKQAPNPWN